MTKRSYSIIVPAARGLAVLALAVLATGCISDQVKDFTPKSGMVCDQVHITGKFHHFGEIKGVWFGDVPAEASLRHVPAPKGPLEIVATVPEHATNGPIRVKITLSDAVPLFAKDTDYTFRGDFTVTGSPPTPTINSFSASPAAITAGQTCTLRWDVAPAVMHLTLDGADVTGTTSKTVTPTTTTYFGLVAKGDSCLLQRQTVVVIVTNNPASESPTNPPVAAAPAVVPAPPVPAPAAAPAAVSAPEATTPVAPAAHPPEHPTAKSESAPAAGVPAAAPAATAPATAPAVTATHAGPMTVKTNPPPVETEKNGPFVDVTAKIGRSDQTCGSRQLLISTNVPGGSLPCLALFRQDGTVLAQYGFQPDIIGGAAFSPGGDQAVVVTADPNGFSASYVEVIERFATHYQFRFPVNVMDGFTVATNRWHVLFSPDDTIVLVSTVPVASPGKIAIQIHDLAHQRNIGSLIQARCQAGRVQAEVLNGTAVQVTVDGAVVATVPIRPPAGMKGRK